MFKRLISKLSKPPLVNIVTPSRPPLPDDLDPALTAYDLTLDPGADPAHPAVAGWCFGLPPGITPIQWPLDPESGYPLQHGFTLRLPDAFKVRGPDIVAISFFGTAADHNDGVPLCTDGLREIILSPATPQPEDPHLRTFWDHAQNAHPLLHRMKDVLGCQFAVIPLTAAELAGSACAVPNIATNPLLANTIEPQWMRIGGAASLLGLEREYLDLEKLTKGFKYRSIGGMPEKRVDHRVPIVLRPRQDDPNGGKAVGHDDYIMPYDENYQRPDWVKNLRPCHLGGTMFPQQAVPHMGAHYIEFEEYFGNFNFGGGNAQLDLKTFAFDWAC
ncbi:hypothetical protein [Jannaschia pohangensis]|nr:hypothetical protein [Jannaschia pohangensis]